ncbi:NUDIX domain-containing protein [Ciceribacter sp. L1K22]|uniref:NUDIX domain-containing protein n=1 Tax=Ciceribacter sp. L1K22 TaxID=2820275 RepID=UPI001ABE8BDA|nr:NUDIX domain-containing protein [Ciceribacter sp. L1K22]MBO3759727.1 NUDIX domain-containing protein [Ciceribacter sp. L1K22]
MTKFDRTKIAVVSDETLWKGWSHLRRLTFDYTSDEGETSRLTWEVLDRGEAACVLLYDEGRDFVVLVRQFRVPAYLKGDRPFLLEVPAGGLEAGEDPAEAIRREILEETGYQVGEIRELFSAYMSPGAFAEKVHFFHAAVTPDMKVSAGGGHATEHEDLEVLEVPVADAFAMIESGDIVDGKTIMLLQWLALRRKE